MVTESVVEGRTAASAIASGALAADLAADSAESVRVWGGSWSPVVGSTQACTRHGGR
jgi:hypothetical protein